VKNGPAHALSAIEKLAVIVFYVAEIDDNERDQNSQEKSHCIFPSCLKATDERAKA
jgi:hypothetical protein